MRTKVLVLLAAVLLLGLGCDSNKKVEPPANTNMPLPPPPVAGGGGGKSKAAGDDKGANKAAPSKVAD